MGYSKSNSKRQFIAINAFIKKKGRSQISNLTLHLKELEKEQTMPTVSYRKAITNIRTEINNIRTEKKKKTQVGKTNETKSFFLKLKIDKPRKEQGFK